MKTAISIPDDVFEEAERLAIELETSRSQLYSRALREFVARHAPERLTEAMNRVVDEVGPEIDEFSQRAACGVGERIVAERSLSRPLQRQGYAFPAPRAPAVAL
jgi:antitoxin MazE6